MSAGAEPPTEPRPRLNPFVFPSDTTFRFGLLVVAVLGTNLYVWNWIQTATLDANAFAADALECLRLNPAVARDPQSFGAAADSFSACVNELNRPVLWWMLGGTAALLLAAAVLVAAAPWWIARRRQLEPLLESDAPAVLARLHELSAEAGLARAPRFAWNPLDAGASGLAFGHAGRYTVALTGGLVTKHVTDPPAFDAVVRHELAHLRNRDVDTTYFTLAVWYAFLLVAVVPFAFTLLDESAETVADLSWRLAALAALVYLTRNAVLRSREVYADVRASVSDGRDGALRRVVAALKPGSSGPAGRLLRLHPEPAARLKAIDDTSPLFRVRPLEAFGAGVAATVAYESVLVMVGLLGGDLVDIRFRGALSFAPLVVGVVGFAIWRRRFASVAEGRPAGLPWRAGLALGAGFLVGPQLELSRGILDDEKTLLGGVFAGDGAWWALALVAGLALLVAWLDGTAAIWLRALGARRPIVAASFGLLVATAVLTVCAGVFYSLRFGRDVVVQASIQGTAEQHAIVAETVWAGPRVMWQAVMDPLFLVIAQRPLVVPVLALLWIYPFAASLVRLHRDDHDAGWAFLDGDGSLPAPRTETQPLRPLAIGLLAGLGFCAFAVVLRLVLRGSVSAETRATDAFVLAFFVWLIALAVLAQAAASTVAAALSRNASRVVDGLAAAFVAGCFATLAIVGGPAAGGCIEPLAMNPGPCAWTVPRSFSIDVLQQVLAEGMIAALASGLVVVGARAWLARRHAADEPVAAGVSA